jgi:hypothetical protein
MRRRFNFEPNTAGDNAIEVSVNYQKPGYNYYNGDKEPGGFYVSFQPGTYTTSPNSNFGSFSFTMFTTGFKIKVCDGTRDNKKKCEKILNLVTKEIAEKAFEGDKGFVFQSIKEFKL